MASDIFSLTPAQTGTARGGILPWLARPLEYLLGLNRCRDIYRRVRHLDQPGLFMEKALADLGIDATCAAADKEKIPAKGACVVVSNHPFGGIDGIILAQLLLSVRPDVKILANSLLDRMPQLRKLTFSVDPFGGTVAARANLGPLRQAMRWVENGAFSVWYARAEQIPHLLLEIGRLREIAFRQAHEGTGKALDLDRFDRHYLHLFIWNDETSEVVGAYRLGQTDEILAARGRKGLYTSTLFHSRMDFFRKLGPALEMGRSFVRPEYQKSYSPLLLLWRGIGTYVARNPRYRMLFGPVSISRDYSDLSRRLMATTLMRHSQAKELALMVKPRKPARLDPIRIRGCDDTTHDVQFQDFKEVCSVVADIEFQQKEVPVLLRQYLNLGGQILSFNIDKLFSDVMDGLIVVDLLQTERKTLERYMGAEGLFTFLAHHYAKSIADRNGVTSSGEKLAMAT